MVTQFAAAIEVRELGACIGSLAQHDSQIANALNLLLTGV
jgi:toxin CcdB